jgi:hypothetical protein
LQTRLVLVSFTLWAFFLNSAVSVSPDASVVGSLLWPCSLNHKCWPSLLLLLLLLDLLISEILISQPYFIHPIQGHSESFTSTLAFVCACRCIGL